MAAASLVGGCKKKDNAAPATGSGSAVATGSGSAAAPATGSGSASGSGAAAPAAPAAPAAAFDWTKAGDASALPAGDPVDDMAFAELAHKVGKPGAPFPQDADWHLDGSNNYGGNLSYAWKKYGKNGDLDTYYISMHWMDCRAKDIKTVAGKEITASDKLDYIYCWAKPNGKKIGTYDRYDKDGQDSVDQRVMKVGKILVIASVGTGASSVAKPTDIEAFMQTLPLADLQKM
ncbi:MAG TPA: hypothetical protein VGM90_24930 [Kofleriaceae bacterium]